MGPRTAAGQGHDLIWPPGARAGAGIAGSMWLPAFIRQRAAAATDLRMPFDQTRDTPLEPQPGNRFRVGAVGGLPCLPMPASPQQPASTAPKPSSPTSCMTIACSFRSSPATGSATRFRAPGFPEAEAGYVVEPFGNTDAEQRETHSVREGRHRSPQSHRRVGRVAAGIHKTMQNARLRLPFALRTSEGFDGLSSLRLPPPVEWESGAIGKSMQEPPGMFAGWISKTSAVVHP